MDVKYCNSCGEEFEAQHGNTGYCSDDCYMDSKRNRQKALRDGIKPLLPILFKNHRILERLWKDSKREFTEGELTAEQLDSSLCRHLYPTPDNPSIVRLDFGTYYLETDNNFSTLKLYKHETTTI